MIEMKWDPGGLDKNPPDQQEVSAHLITEPLQASRTDIIQQIVFYHKAICPSLTIP